MMNRLAGERGAALLMILLFMALMFIVVTTMLGTVGNEIIIAGSHRDSVRALEHAQAGLEEGIRRIEAGRQYGASFSGSLAPGITIDVVDVLLGQGGGYLEVQSEAQVGLARRRLSALVLGQANSSLGDIVFGYSLASQGAARITGGDVYSETFVSYKVLPTDPDSITFSAWAIEKRSPDPIPWCYTVSCGGQPKWRPGTRRSEYKNAQFRAVGIPNINPVADPRSGATELNFTCPAGPPAPYNTQTIGADGPGYQSGDRRADLAPADPLQLSVAAEPLYGCDPVDNRPYTWVREVIDKNGDGNLNPVCEANNPDDVNGDGCPEFLWMKTVVYEDWFNAYWCFNADPAVLSYEKCNGLESNPALGAIPPFPVFDTLDDNYDQYQTGGGVVSGSTSLDFGCKAPEMTTCPNNESVATIVLLDNGNYRVNANLQGYGVLLVDGDLEVNGTLEYWGVMVVKGKLILGNGNVIIHGGLIAEDTAEISGSIIIEAGVSLANKILGPAAVTQKIWWER